MTSRATLQCVQWACRATSLLGRRRPFVLTTNSFHELQANPSRLLGTLSSRCDAEPVALVRKMLFLSVSMGAEALYDRPTPVANADNWLALGTGALLLLVGASRRFAVGACLEMRRQCIARFATNTTRASRSS
jgi:hypothetical protein